MGLLVGFWGGGGGVGGWFCVFGGFWGGGGGCFFLFFWGFLLGGGFLGWWLCGRVRNAIDTPLSNFDLFFKVKNGRERGRKGHNLCQKKVQGPSRKKENRFFSFHNICDQKRSKRRPGVNRLGKKYESVDCQREEIYKT